MTISYTPPPPFSPTAPSANNEQSSVLPVSQSFIRTTKTMSPSGGYFVNASSASTLSGAASPKNSIVCSPVDLNNSNDLQQIVKTALSLDITRRTEKDAKTGGYLTLPPNFSDGTVKKMATAGGVISKKDDQVVGFILEAVLK